MELCLSPNLIGRRRVINPKRSPIDQPILRISLNIQSTRSFYMERRECDEGSCYSPLCVCALMRVGLFGQERVLRELYFAQYLPLTH